MASTSDRLSAGAASPRRDHAVNYQHAAAIAEVSNGVSRFSGLRPGTRPDTAHHLRFLFRRSGQETCQRLRAVMEDGWYRELFPGTRIGQKDSESEIELTA